MSWTERPDQRGLRRSSWTTTSMPCNELDRTPRSEGIKTDNPPVCWVSWYRLDRTPRSEGIKTLIQISFFFKDIQLDRTPRSEGIKTTARVLLDEINRCWTERPDQRGLRLDLYASAVYPSVFSWTERPDQRGLRPCLARLWLITY